MSTKFKIRISAKVPTLSDKMAKEEEEVRKPGSMVAKRQRLDNLSTLDERNVYFT